MGYRGLASDSFQRVPGGMYGFDRSLDFEETFRYSPANERKERQRSALCASKVDPKGLLADKGISPSETSPPSGPCVRPFTPDRPEPARPIRKGYRHRRSRPHRHAHPSDRRRKDFLGV